MEQFDANWAGPEDLRPRCYRSQNEKDIWYSIRVENEYRLPELDADDVVIDIGANIGAFSHLAYSMGSRSIYAFELEAYNYEGALRNLEGMGDGIALYHCGVVRGDSYRARQYFANGSWNTFGAVGTPVASRSLDQLLDPHDHVRFIKMDCEGCEYPILYTCTQLHKVQEIAGEYHVISQDYPEMQNLPYPVSRAGLEAFLADQGFNTHFIENAPDIGNFWAWRSTAAPPPVPKYKDLKEIAAKLRECADSLDRLQTG